MPQSSDDLRKKFMTPADRDGVDTCSTKILAAGGRIDNGYILYSGEDPEVLEAIQFLVEEWDCCSYKPTVYPLYVTKTVMGARFICVRKSDTEKSDWHVISDDGINYGSWQSVENFVNAYKTAKATEPTDKLKAEPLGRAMLSIRSL